MTNYNFRSVTQADVNNTVSSELNFWSTISETIDWNSIFNDTFQIYTRMRERNIIDEVYGLDEMINNAISEYNWK